MLRAHGWTAARWPQSYAATAVIGDYAAAMVVVVVEVVKANVTQHVLRWTTARIIITIREHNGAHCFASATAVAPTITTTITTVAAGDITAITAWGFLREIIRI